MENLTEEQQTQLALQHKVMETLFEMERNKPVEGGKTFDEILTILANVVTHSFITIYSSDQSIDIKTLPDAISGFCYQISQTAQNDKATLIAACAESRLKTQQNIREYLKSKDK